MSLKSRDKTDREQIIVLLICDNLSKETERRYTKMTQQFRYVAGHIEVYTENGEFLFSADTMQEAWEELSA